MKYLEAFDMTQAQSLLERVSDCFRSVGILIDRNFALGGAETISENKSDETQWIKFFVIQPTESAFYLKIDSPDDISVLNKDLERRLKTLQSELKKFLENNNELAEDLKSKINTFATSALVKAQQFVVRGGLKKLVDVAKNCNSVDEIRAEAGKRYADFIKKELLDRIVFPLYDGLRMNPKEEAYRYVLSKTNQFLGDLGVMTVNVSVGELFDDDSFYAPAEESNSDEYRTTNADEKDIIRAVVRYAYVFQEDKGANNRQISEGEVIVMSYQPEGGQ